jgi:phage shock protein PspC (stress-responsive transcriptional regulator)
MMIETNDYVLLGVCSRLAKFLEIDPLIVRIAFVLTGSVLFYLVLAYLLNRKEKQV